MPQFPANLNLSSLDGSSGFQINGAAANDYSGWSVARAGDVNGDGFNDLIIGAMIADPNGTYNSGTSYVVFGKAGGFSANVELSAINGATGFRIQGEFANDRSGRSVASAGDVNGDGADDLIIGAYLADPHGLSSGVSYVVFGRIGGFAATLDLSNLNGANGFRINGETTDDESGRSVATAGDVNGDGFDDLIIGALGSDPNGFVSAGASYVVFGKAGGFGTELNLSSLNGANGFKINGELAGDFSGRSVASAGDINGDGYDDLIIGASGADPAGLNSGASYVVFGKAAGFSANLELKALDGGNGFQISGEAVGDLSGVSVASAGDVNGDGFADLAIGTAHAGGTGATYVVFGKAGGFTADFNLATLDGTNGFQINGEGAGDNSGWSVASAGDVNSDGFDDLLIGASGANPNGLGSGATYVVFGKAGGFDPALELSTLSRSAGFQINGETGYDRSGASVSAAGDVNGDGFDDIVIGAYGADFNGTGAGASYVIFGKDTSALSQLSEITPKDGFRILAETQTQGLGHSVASAGDFNGDGFDDIIVGAHQASPNGANSGTSYLIFGSRDGFPTDLDLNTLSPASGFKIHGAIEQDTSGWSVASAGDVNGDKLSDLIIGAPGSNFPFADSGTSYVVFGKTTPITTPIQLSALNGTTGFKINGEVAFDYSGGSVASAGDINNDNFDDVIIGARGSDANGGGGSAYVLFGKAGGFSSNINLLSLTATQGFQVNGGPGQAVGWSVASAGDINNDNFDDIIVGAEGAMPNGTLSGATYVVFGKGTAFSLDFDLTKMSVTDGFKINGEAAGDRSGASVAAAGDVNGDGFDDMIIGAPNAAPHGALSGASYVVFGKAGGFGTSLDLSSLVGTNGFQVSGASAGDKAGFSVASAGDFNGDGFDDLLIGAGYARPNGAESGTTYLVYGKASGFAADFDLSTINGRNGFQIEGEAGTRSGQSVATAGDVNKDGYDDLIIGATQGSMANDAGNSAYVIYGHATINGAPSGANDVINIVEDTLYTFTKDDFGFADPNGNAFASVIIETIASKGVLEFDDITVKVGAVISVADLGKLTYTSAKNGVGDPYASFTFKVRDGAGTDNKGADTDPTANRLTLNISDVIDYFTGRKTKRDTLIGSDGQDILNGKSGNDTLKGGASSDNFVFKRNWDKDRIRDFDAVGPDHDVLDIRALNSVSSFADLKKNHMQQAGSKVVIDGLNGDVVTLLGVKIGDLDKSDFLI